MDHTEELDCGGHKLELVDHHGRRSTAEETRSSSPATTGWSSTVEATSQHFDHVDEMSSSSMKLAPGRGACCRAARCRHRTGVIDSGTRDRRRRVLGAGARASRLLPVPGACGGMVPGRGASRSSGLRFGGMGGGRDSVRKGLRGKGVSRSVELGFLWAF